jgi:hypothetical protein
VKSLTRRRPPQTDRTVEVLPPSQSEEASWVFTTAAFVVLCVIYVVAFQRNDLRSGTAEQDPARALLPFQVLFRDLPNSEQRVFREMQEGVLEALRERGSKGSWPRVEALASAGVPPFAQDVLDRAGLRWTLKRDGLIVNYLGVPATQGEAPAFLILVQEPDPVTGEKTSPTTAVDEEHQVLPDGTLLHVTYWKRAAPIAADRTFADPANQGWLQIRVKTVLEEMGSP